MLAAQALEHSEAVRYPVRGLRRTKDGASVPLSEGVMKPTREAEVAASTIAAARRGDSAAFLAILRHYDRRLRLIAYRLVGDRSLMDDALQEVAIKAARALPGMRDDAALGAWLYRITYRTCLDLLRYEGRLDPPALEDLATREASSADPAGGADPADIVVARDAAAHLLAMLPPDQRLAVLLVDQEGFDYRTAAEVLGIPMGTVASRLSVARGKLRRALRSPTRHEEES